MHQYFKNKYENLVWLVAVLKNACNYLMPINKSVLVMIRLKDKHPNFEVGLKCIIMVF